MVMIQEKAKISDPVKGVPVADHAFVFYSDGHGYCAVTAHNIKEGRLGLGRVVSMSSIAERFARYTGAGKKMTLLPPSVIVSSERDLVWTSRPRFAPMWFSVDGHKRAFRVWWPNLLWVADKKRGSLRIFALGSTKRPTLNSPVYHAPLMNIGNNGDLCVGSARPPRFMDESRLAEIEACIFDSNFTHVNHTATARGVRTNKQHLAFWKGKEASGQRCRVCELVRFGTLEDVLK